MRLLYSRHLEHFLAVYHSGSLRKAAEDSGVSQPALTKSLQVLEKAFSVPLFERRASGMAPTRAAELLHRHAQHIINSARYAEMEISHLRKGQSGVLRIGSGIVWTATGMPQLVADLHARFPQLRIETYEGVAAQLTAMLVDGELDVMFAAVPEEPLGDTFQTVELPSVKMAVFCRERHPLAPNRRVSLRQLSEYTFINYTHSRQSTHQLRVIFSSAGLPAPQIAIRAASTETLLATIAASDSIAVLAEPLIALAAEAGVTTIDLDHALWELTMGITFRKQSAELAPVQALIELAKS